MAKDDDPVSTAHERLAALFLEEDAIFETPLGIVEAFHDWAERTEQPVDILDFREMHVRRVHRLDERTSLLAFEWAETLEAEMA